MIISTVAQGSAHEIFIVYTCVRMDIACKSGWVKQSFFIWGHIGSSSWPERSDPLAQLCNYCFFAAHEALAQPIFDGSKVPPWDQNNARLDALGWAKFYSRISSVIFLRDALGRPLVTRQLLCVVVKSPALARVARAGKLKHNGPVLLPYLLWLLNVWQQPEEFVFAMFESV